VTSRLALIIGGGGVLGQALCDEFVGAGFDVACLRRNPTPDARSSVSSMACDLADAAAVHDAVAQVIRERGPVNTLIHNAAHFRAAPFLELSAADLEESWRVGVAGAAAAARATLPSMLQHRRGTIVFSGATGSLRGSANFAALASAKFALRGLAQALAREYQAAGIHVAHVVIDGLLSGSPSLQRFARPDARTLDPADVARTFRWIAEQPVSAWTHELDLRPVGERF